MAIPLIGWSQQAAGQAAGQVVEQGRSTFAAMLNAARGANPSGPTTAPDASAPTDGGTPVDPTERARTAQGLLTELEAKLRHILRAAGIDTSHAIRLEMDPEGQVRVASDHPDRLKIEKIFGENPELVAQFAELASAYEDLDATADHAPDENMWNDQRFALTLDNGRLLPSLG